MNRISDGRIEHPVKYAIGFLGSEGGNVWAAIDTRRAPFKAGEPQFNPVPVTLQLSGDIGAVAGTAVIDLPPHLP
jgi:hypothetical protein